MLTVNEVAEERCFSGRRRVVLMDTQSAGSDARPIVRLQRVREMRNLHLPKGVILSYPRTLPPSPPRPLHNIPPHIRHLPPKPLKLTSQRHRLRPLPIRIPIAHRLCLRPRLPQPQLLHLHTLRRLLYRRGQRARSRGRRRRGRGKGRGRRDNALAGGGDVGWGAVLEAAGERF